MPVATSHLRARLLLLALLPPLLRLGAAAQEQGYDTAIEDNSFLIEEAFNQEHRVVQHISTLTYQREEGHLEATFTQEWPVGSQAHQLSYTIPYVSLGGGARGVGDIMINYRYQLAGEGSWAFVAPRLSVILPTGSSSRGTGSGSPGLEMNIPVSKRLSNGFIVHVNAGTTWLASVEGMTPAGESVHKSLVSPFMGASGIFLLDPDFNLMLEALFSSDASLKGAEVTHESSLTLVPGFRFAVNLGSLQIVPGFALPIRLGAFTPQFNVFGYLSFEHPF